MPAAEFGLSTKQEALVEALFSSDGIILAAKAAGYADSSHVRRMVRHSPVLRAAIEQELRHRLQTEGAPVAYALLVEVVRNKDSKFGERVRVDAARTLLDRAGFLPPKQPDRQPAEKDLNEMSTAELLAIIEKHEAELGDRATPINAVQIAPSVETQLGALLD
jgi:hypothetical protein